MPNGCASPTTRSAPYSAGVFSSDRLTGLTAAMTVAPAAFAMAARSSTGSIRPR